MLMIKFILLLILIFSYTGFSQDENILQDISRKFESFKYDSVITTADSLLSLTDSLSDQTLVELYRMKGISHFSLDQNKLAEESFLAILKIDSTFHLDSAKTSPKIISFFNETRTEFKQHTQFENLSEQAVDTIYITQKIPDPEIEYKIKGAFFRSILLPGLGHLYLNDSFKGWFLTALSSASLVSSVYFIFDTETKRDGYANETNINKVAGKYDEYNSAYKKRNFSLIAFAALWVYSQIDLLLFSDFTSPQIVEQVNVGYNDLRGIQLNFNVTF